MIAFSLDFLYILEGDNCQVKDPRHGNLYDLKPLSFNDTIITAGEYTYYFRVCGKLSSNVCSVHDGSKVVSSCQEKKGPQGFQKVTGTVLFFLSCKMSRDNAKDHVSLTWEERATSSQNMLSNTSKLLSSLSPFHPPSLRLWAIYFVWRQDGYH